MSPTVSVIMPLFNSSKFMEESILSVLQQDLKNLELILVDDCSTDNTLEKAKAFADYDSRVRVVPLAENGGGGAARNAGISLARGQYIAFLDSDDCWEQGKLVTQLSLMTDRGAQLSYTDYAVVAETGDIVRTVYAPDKLSYHDLLKDNVIGCSTVVYDSEALGKRYFPLIRRRQDFGLWLSILHDVQFAYRCGSALTRYRLRHDSVSANKLRAAAFTWRVYRNVERLSLPRASYYFAHYVFSAVRKRM